MRKDPYAVCGAFLTQEYSEDFARDAVRERVVPTYMGLVRQIDDHLGRLIGYLEARALLERTLVVFTSDHGDYLGDHWFGEKDLFHECSARIPVIVCDPSPEADATRGTADARFVEQIDLLPTFVEFAGDEIRTERVEGRSLLFDMENDPDELVDLDADPGYGSVRRKLHERLFTWFRRRRNRTETEESFPFGTGPSVTNASASSSAGGSPGTLGPATKRVQPLTILCRSSSSGDSPSGGLRTPGWVAESEVPSPDRDYPFGVRPGA